MNEELYIGKPDEPWVDFTEDFDYDKVFYDVLLSNGEIVKHCWPNAGRMNAINGDGRKWGGEDGVKVRPSMDHPEDDGLTARQIRDRELARPYGGDKMLIVEDEFRKAEKKYPKAVHTLALMSAVVGDLGHISKFIDSCIPRGPSGFCMSTGTEDGKPFKDSRGQTFVRVKGTIRRWKEPKEDGTKDDIPASTSRSENAV